MLNVVLAPLGLILIALGGWGLLRARRNSRRDESSPGDSAPAPGDEENDALAEPGPHADVASTPAEAQPTARRDT